MRFIGAFLREENIKWVLTMGIALVVGSSMMLVTTHWEDYTPLGKLLTVMAYTGGFFQIGMLLYQQMGLRKTGAGLLTASILLLPLQFFALHWIRGSGSDGADVVFMQGGQIAFFVMALALSFHVARKAFGLLIGRVPPTFLASFLILSASGAICPLLPGSAAIVTAAILIAVYFFGAIKINRFIFWTSEFGRRRQVAAYCPMLVLFALFVANFCLFIAPHCSLDWIGFTCTLAAIPLLLCADDLARVFQQRTGNINQSLPMAIAAPLLLGLIVSSSGLMMAATTLPKVSLALAPSAVLVALQMALLARRLNQSALVWAAIVASVIGYNFSPAYFREAAAEVVAQGASSLREPKLPFAYYGITFLPLIATFAGFSYYLKRRGEELFSEPLRRAACALAFFLLLLSATHTKALLPVGATSILTFTCLSLMFRDRRLLLPTFIAWAFAIFGWPIMAESVFGSETLAQIGIFLFAALGFLSLWLRRFEKKRISVPVFTEAATAIAASLVIYWLPAIFVVYQDLSFSVAAVTAIAITTLLGFSATAHRSSNWGMVGIVFGHLSLLIVGVEFSDLHGFDLTAITLLLLLFEWYAITKFKKRLSASIQTALINPGELFNRLLLTIGFFGTTLIIAVRATGDGVESPYFLILAAQYCLGIWGLKRSWRQNDHAIASVTAVIIYASCTEVVYRLFGHDSFLWIPTLWALLALAIWPFIEGLKSTQAESKANNFTQSDPYLKISLFVLVCCSIPSLMFYGFAFKSVGIISTLAIAAFGFRLNSKLLLTSGLVLLNWHLIGFFLQVLVMPWADHAGTLATYSLTGMSTELFALICVSGVLWRSLRRKFLERLNQDYVNFHCLMLAGLTSLTLLLDFSSGGLGLLLESGVELDWGRLFLASCGFLTVATDSAIAAYRGQKPMQAWMTIIALAGLFLWAVLQGFIQFNSNFSLVAISSCAIAIHVFASFLFKCGAYRVFAKPLNQISLALPAFAMALALGQELFGFQGEWIGLRSLGLYLGAGFYFYYGWELGHKRYQIVALFMSYLAFALLWRELDWTDPQFYLVPLGSFVFLGLQIMKRELPPSTFHAMQYAGALMILVSPTFNILTGSWLHLFCLMALSLLVAFVGIGTQVRALVYTGFGFLVADIVAMIVRGSIDDPNMLWVAGIVLGIGVLALAAMAENHRENLIDRVRRLSATLESWN